MSQATPLAGKGRRVATGLDAGLSCFSYDDLMPLATPTVGEALTLPGHDSRFPQPCWPTALRLRSRAPYIDA